MLGTPIPSSPFVARVRRTSGLINSIPSYPLAFSAIHEHPDVFAADASFLAGLLIILSQGSDPLSMNDHYEKVFDAISTVHHNKNDKQVTAMKSICVSFELRFCILG